MRHTGDQFASSDGDVSFAFKLACLCTSLIALPLPLLAEALHPSARVSHGLAQWVLVTGVASFYASFALELRAIALRLPRAASEKAE